MSKSKLSIVNHESHADYNVYFVQSPSKEKNQQIIKDCVLTKSGSVNVKVFIVNSESKADICIMQKNFPKSA